MQQIEHYDILCRHIMTYWADNVNHYQSMHTVLHGCMVSMVLRQFLSKNWKQNLQTKNQHI